MNSTRYVASLAAIGILLLAAVSAFMSLRNTPSNLAVTTSSVLKPRLTMTDNTYTVKVPIREKHTKTINYTVNLMVPEQRKKTLEYHTVRYETRELPRN